MYRDEHIQSGYFQLVLSLVSEHHLGACKGKGTTTIQAAASFMASTRSQTKNMDSWVQEKEEMRSRIELNEARTKKGKLVKETLDFSRGKLTDCGISG
ncbi:hypothetical protein Lal_00014111 [Lupinus albus]|nr:hypothetical protein Lal_00014111 [Lupinus albus]